MPLPDATFSWAAPATAGNIQDTPATLSIKPPFIPAPNCAKVSNRYLLFDQPSENVFYFYNSAGWTTSTLELLASTVITEWIANMLPIMSADVTMVEVQCDDMTTATSASVVQSYAGGTHGTSVTGIALPGVVSCCVQLTTGFRGKSLRGRLYLSGMTSGDESADTLTSTYLASVITAVQACMDNIGSTVGGTLVIVSFRGDKLWRLEGYITTVLGFVVNRYVCTQRRRLIGHNRHR